MLNINDFQKDKLISPFDGMSKEVFIAELKHWEDLGKRDSEIRKLGEAADRYWKLAISSSWE